MYSHSNFRNIAKHVTEFVLHGIGVLLNCMDLTQLLSLSSALVVCLKATTETIAFVREKNELLAAIDRCPPSVSEDLHLANDQEKAVMEIRSQSRKIRDISPFSVALRRQITENMREVEDETSDSTNILCSLKVLEYLKVYICHLVLLWSGLLLGKVQQQQQQHLYSPCTLTT